MLHITSEGKKSREANAKAVTAPKSNAKLLRSKILRGTIQRSMSPQVEYRRSVSSRHLQEV